MTDHTERKTTTKAQFAHDAAHQLAYILGALGLPDNYGATTALLAALESGGSLKVAAETMANVLREIKTAVRANVENSKAVSRDRDTARDRIRKERDAAQDKAISLARDLDQERYTVGRYADSLASARAGRKILAEENTRLQGDLDAARADGLVWFKEAERLQTDAQRARDRSDYVCVACGGSTFVSDGDEGNLCRDCGGSTVTSRKNYIDTAKGA